MDYRKEIIDMIKRMKNEDYLRRIYIFIKVKFEKEERDQG